MKKKVNKDNDELVHIVSFEELKERFYPKGTWRRFTYDIGYFLFKLKVLLWQTIKKKEE
jgi:hypothetical protein